MRKVIVIVICLVLLCSFGGCGKETGNQAGASKHEITEEIRGTPMDEMRVLKEQYPEYFDLSTTKGLEVYVWQMAPNSYKFGLLEGTNREKTIEELWNLKGTSAENMRVILSSYDIDERDVIIIPWQNSFSSYIPEDLIGPEDEDPDSAAQRRQAYIDRIREMLFGIPDSAG